MRTLYQIVSAVLHPLLIPLFGTILLFQVGIFSELPLNYRLYIEGLVFLNMGLVPGLGIWLLKKSGHVSDYDVSIRSERLFPYLISLISYLTACYVLFRYQMPWWVLKLFFGSILATILAFLITLKWKISAHTMSYGALVAASFLVCLTQSINPIVYFILLILLGGLQASSRLFLNAHSLSQVIGGFILGFFSVCCTFFLIP